MSMSRQCLVLLGQNLMNFAARFCNSAHLYSVSRSLAAVKYEYYDAECGVFAMLRRFFYCKFL